MPEPRRACQSLQYVAKTYKANICLSQRLQSLSLPDVENPIAGITNSGIALDPVIKSSSSYGLPEY